MNHSPCFPNDETNAQSKVTYPRSKSRFISCSSGEVKMLVISHSVMSDFLWSHGLDSPPGSSVCRILQARTLDWVAIPFSKVSFPPRNQTQVSCIAGRFFTVWATREALSCSAGLQISWYFHIPSPTSFFFFAFFHFPPATSPLLAGWPGQGVGKQASLRKEVTLPGLQGGVEVILIPLALRASVVSHQK